MSWPSESAGASSNGFLGIFMLRGDFGGLSVNALLGMGVSVTALVFALMAAERKAIMK